MTGTAINTKIPPSYKRPGIYTTIILGDPGGSVANNRVLIWALVGAGLPATPNVPFLPSSIADVQGKCGGASAMAAHAYAAASSDPRYRGAEKWVMPLLEPSGGTKAKHLITFMAAPVAGVLGTNTTASSGGTVGIWFASRGIVFSFKRGDTFAAIATAAGAALATRQDLPVKITVTGALIEAEDIYKGEHGNDMPTVVTITEGSGVAASCGTVTFAGTTSAIGSVTAKLNAQRLTNAIASGDGEDDTAPALAAALNSDGYCVSGAVASPATGVLTLFYRNDRPVHRLAFSLTGATGQTVAVALGVLGVGIPTLTSAISRLSANKKAFEHSVFFTDATSWSALAAHIIAEAETPKEKGQGVYGALIGNLQDVADSTLADLTTPKLYTDYRFALLWQQGAMVRGFELAARAAALVASSSSAGTNFNGERFVGSELAPMGVPNEADWPMDDEVNTSIATYKLAPITVDDGGYNILERSSNTYKSVGTADQKAEKWSFRRTIDKCRADVRLRFGKLFGKKNIKAHGEPRTERAIKPANVKTAGYELMVEWDNQDLFDGAAAYKDALQVAILEAPTRINFELPLVPLADLDQITTVGVAQ